MVAVGWLIDSVCATSLDGELPALEAARLDFPVRVHDLRHAHASWLLAGGADLKTVMERMGNTQIMTTHKYLHSLPDAQDKALVAFESIRNRS